MSRGPAEDQLNKYKQTLKVHADSLNYIIQHFYPITNSISCLVYNNQYFGARQVVKMTV